MESLHISFQRVVDVGMFTGIKLSSSLNIKIKSRLSNWKLTSFWKDKWHNEGVLKDVFPRLYALERHQNVTIHTKLIDYSLVNSFRRNPRSGVEEFQLDNLSRLVSTITLSSAVDRWVICTSKWGGTLLCHIFFNVIWLTVGSENIVLVECDYVMFLYENGTLGVSLRPQAISKRVEASSIVLWSDLMFRKQDFFERGTPFNSMIFDNIVLILIIGVPWSNERPLENKELNGIIGAWFTLWQD
ncbi:hypothetical protein Tco_0960248 [Tanacetum coccineum]